MARVVLQEQQRELLRRERQIASELQACLIGFEGADAYATTLRQVTDTLDEMFLLVVVGEFNAGKSACINALLHENVLEEGVVPTTTQIIIMRYGEKSEQSQRQRVLLELHYPADFLQDISIVDTPGTNAIQREHERLTEEFIPRSDLILFITSVDRPFTESERCNGYLAHPFKKVAPWAFTARLFLVVKWGLAIEIAEEKLSWTRETTRVWAADHDDWSAKVAGEGCKRPLEA